MKNIKLKNTDLTVSNVVMGTDSLGSLVDKDLSYELLDFYRNSGGNTIDTAECYAHWVTDGIHASEKLIGRWLKDRNCRSEIVISTKGGFYQLNQPHRLTEKDIFEDLDGSLKRLGTDYVDIYWLHRDAVCVSVEEIMDILRETVKQGKVRYIGVSNWTYKRISEANDYAVKMGYPKLFASQIQYSAAEPNVEKNEPDLVLMNDNEYEYFKNNDMTVFAFAAQAKGFFSKYHNGGEEMLSPKARDRYLNEETLKRYKNLLKVCENHNCTVGNAVIASLTNNHDFTTLPIIGCKNIPHLKEALDGADITLTKEEVDEIFNR